MFYSVLVLHHAFSIEQCFFCLISHIFFSRLCFVCKLYVFNWVEGVRQGARFLFPAGSRLSQHRCSGVTAVPPLLVSGPVRSSPVRVTRPPLPSRPACFSARQLRAAVMLTPHHHTLKLTSLLVSSVNMFQSLQHLPVPCDFKLMPAS